MGLVYRPIKTAKNKACEGDTKSSQNGIRSSRGPIEWLELSKQHKGSAAAASSVTTTTTTTIRIAGSSSTETAEMLLPRRHPRFSLLLASFIFTALLLLLPHGPLAALQSPSASSTSPTPSSQKSPPVAYHQGVATRVRRAERAYQKMLRGRDALIAKVGPTPRDVALFVLGTFFWIVRR